MPTKATSFTQKNTRTQKGATIVDLEYNGQMVGTLAQLPNGKWTVRDANGQGIGKQVHTSWLARKILSDYLNAKGGSIAPPPPPPQPAPIAPTPKPAPPVPAPPPAPAPTPTPPPAPVKTPTAPILPKAPTALPVSQFSGGTQFGLGWQESPPMSRQYSSRYAWRQTKAKKFGAQTEWDIEAAFGHGFDAFETATFASMVRVEGGFNVRIAPAFIDMMRKRFIAQYPQAAAQVNDFIPDDITFTANNASRAMTIAKSIFTHGFGYDVNLPPFIARIQDDIVGNIAAKKEAATPIGTTKSKMLPADQLEDGLISGRDIVWDTDRRTLQEILDLHNQSGRRGSSNSDKGLDFIAQLQGWDRGRPALTDLGTFWNTAKIQDNLFLRGDTHHAYASQFKLWATQFYGKGIFGNGTYSAYHRLGATAVGITRMPYQAQDTAKQYADGGYNVEGPVTLGRMKRSSRVIDMEDFMQVMYDDYALALKYRNEYMAAGGDKAYMNDKEGWEADPVKAKLHEMNQRARKIMEMLGDDSGNLIGLYAGLKGFDAIIIQPNAFPHNFPVPTSRSVDTYQGEQLVMAEKGPAVPDYGWAKFKASQNQYLLVMNRSATIAVSGDMNNGAGRRPTASNKEKNGSLTKAPKAAKFTRISDSEIAINNPLNVFMNAMEDLFVSDLAKTVLSEKGLGGQPSLPELRQLFESETEALISRWARRYERAILRGRVVTTITWEESRRFEEIYAKQEDLNTEAGD
jgi:hypothetical protein